MNRYAYVILFLFFFTPSLSAQTSTVTISNGKSCAGQEVLLSITASNLLNIASITLYVDIDTTRLTFVSLENIDPQLVEELYFNYIQSPPRVAVVWNNIVPANFPQTKLFDMKFHVNDVNTPVSFAPGCEIVNASLQLVTIGWLNGAVEPANPVIAIQPKDLTIKSTKNASFDVNSVNATGYQWEDSQDGTTWQNLQDGENYSGTLTDLLTITNVPLSFDKTKFRCNTRNVNCYTVSDVATLTVESSSSINEGMNARNFQLRIQPNPFTESTQIDYTIPEEGNVHIRIYSMLGNLVVDLLDTFHSQGQYKIPFFPNQLPKGIYVCQLEFFNINTNLFTVQKMIKN